MTIQKLKLTSKQVNEIINNRYDGERFEEIFNDIPMYHEDHVMQKGERHTDYMDDSREYRWLIIKDLKTGEEYCINYTYNPDWPNDLLALPDSIEVVKDEKESSLYEAPIVVAEPEPVLSQEAQADKDLWNQYLAVKDECKVLEKKEKLTVPKKVIDEIINFLKNEKFNMFQLRAKIIPVCIEYKLEEKSFWQWIQVKRKVWK